MKFRWTLKKTDKTHDVNALSEQLNIQPVLSKLLMLRGIDSFEKAKKFFRPSYDDFYDPFLMKDMQKAIDRIEMAIKNSEKILIYGDYDVDGTTSVSLVYSFLKKHYEHLDYYIPDRYTEGYGISFAGIDYAADNGETLIIALDCGIKANEKVDYALEKGIDFIICDHHRPGPELPKAAAILNPKQEDCTYPYKELSGCGIGFKLICAFLQHNELDVKQAYDYLDLAAISTACDIVPLEDENRNIVHFGLKKINSNPRLGVAALLEVAKQEKEVDVSDLVFMVGPRINAAGRLEHATKAVELLVSSDLGFTKTGSKEIDATNQDRKTLDKSITDEALAMIRSNSQYQSAKTTVLFKKDWHKGVIGIVASRLIEEYYRPTIMLTEYNGKITGSARSVKHFDVYNAIESCSDLLEQFGGHKYAAGLTLKPENVAAFQSKFEEVVSSQIDPELLIPEIEIDGKLNFVNITPKFYNVLKQFAPFGPSNRRPVFLTQNIVDAGNSRTMGEDGKHLKLHMYQITDPSLQFDAIAFNLGYLFNKIASGEPFHIVYCIEENAWNGKVNLQLRVKDIRFAQ